MSGRIISVIVLLLLISSIAFAAQVPVTEVNAALVRPEKASWIGQQAVLFLPKMYEKANYVFLYNDPMVPMSANQQHMLARKVANQPFTIQGLYQISRGKANEHYWLLINNNDKSQLWIRDFQYLPLAEMPFSLSSEISREAQAKESFNKLTGITVWYNANIAVIGSSARHLEPISVGTILSAGPYSEAYQVTFQTKDGTSLEWHPGISTSPPVYSNAGLIDALKKYFFPVNPRELHPNWSVKDWTLIESQSIQKGWTKDKVLLSWGEPDKKEKLEVSPYSECWTYSNKTKLLFSRNELVKVLIPKKDKITPPADTAGKKKKNNIFAAYDEVTEAVKVINKAPEK